MRIYFVRYLLCFKSKLKSPFTYIWVLLIVFFLYLVRESFIPLQSPGDVYILNRAGAYGERVINLLLEEKGISAYNYVEVYDEEYLRDAVKKGSAQCGFIFSEDMEEKISNGDIKNTVILVTSAFSVRAAAVRESVFAALFRIMNIDIVDGTEKIFFDDPDDVKDYIRERYDYYTSGRGVFGVEYEYAKISETALGNSRVDHSDPVRGIASVLLFILCLYEGGSFLAKKKSFFESLRGTDRFLSMFLYELSAITLPAAFSFVMIRILAGSPVPLIRDMIVFFIFVIFSCAWSVVFTLFFKKTESYYPVVSVMMFVSILICPVFADIGFIIPSVGYASGILPPALYLYMLY